MHSFMIGNRCVFHVVVCEYSRASILIIAVLKVGITLYNIRDSTVRKYTSQKFSFELVRH